MAWNANVIYSTPVASVIEAFRRRGLGDALYVVRDLDGICSEWTRKEFFEKKTSEIRHGLPPDGLLAVMPPLRQTSYSKNWVMTRAAQAQQDDGYGDHPADKWERLGFPGRGRIPEASPYVDWPTGLHQVLAEIANETGERLFHYYCLT